MENMHIIDKILSREEFESAPPVLFDIGASGAIHPKWQAIAKYSICIAFDADNREMDYIVKKSSGYRNLYIFNSIVTDIDTTELNFFLTKSPYCSSALEPDIESLSEFEFAELFEVEKQIKIKCIQLKNILLELKLDRVDWFKTDSQGTDLRLFSNMGSEIYSRVLLSEFEPGIIDAYKGEDKLYELMRFMDTSNFWMSELEIKGNQRINKNVLAKFFNNDKNLNRAFNSKYIVNGLKVSPGWASVTYMNRYRLGFMKRDYLLGWVFAVIEKQFGFALELAINAHQNFGDPCFIELQDYAVDAIRKSSRQSLPRYFLDKLFRKVMSMTGKTTHEY
jgi:hypothetical protein